MKKVIKVHPEMYENSALPPRNLKTTFVPCGKCRLCCQGYSAVMVMTDYGDEPSEYLTSTLPGGGDRLFLQMKENGDCIYLEEDGCTIHGKTPYICRTFDCREQHKMYTKAQREELLAKGLLDKEVSRHAAILIHQEMKGKKDGK